MLRSTGAAGLVATAFFAAACMSDPDPPEPRRTVSPTLPPCITEADCAAGEECREGVCARPGQDLDAGRSPPECSQGCGRNQICVEGVCIDDLIRMQ